MTYFKSLISAVAVIGLAACTTTGNTERNAAIGATAGAVAGAIIGNNVGDGDASTGAAIGAIVGACYAADKMEAIVGGVGGAYTGNQKDKAMGEDTRLRQPAAGQDLYYDQSTGRYYFVDEATGRTYYRNGELRG
jgi:phage tail tape-measure protein